MDKLHRYEEIRTTKNWKPGGAAGLRRRVRTGLADSSITNQTKNK
jgi:hypothetical protein